MAEVSIGLTDFGDDILGFAQPLLEAIGLMKEDPPGSGEKVLNINDWSFEDAIAIFESYERTDSILNLISSFTDIPTHVYRQINYPPDPSDPTIFSTNPEKEISGLLTTESQSSDDYLEEEWFRVYPPKGEQSPWALHFTAIHQKGGPLSDSEVISRGGVNNHHLNLGLGFSLTMPVSDETLELNVSVPMIRLFSTDPSQDFERLIWADESHNNINDVRLASQSRISVTGRLSRTGGGRYESPGPLGPHPSCSAISFGAAIGNGGAKIVLTLEDYKEQESALESDLVIDSWSSAGGVLTSMLSGLVQGFINDLSGSTNITDNLFPILGLRPSSSDTNWPTIDLFDIIMQACDPPIGEGRGSIAIFESLKDWVADLLALNDGPSQWLSHLFNLLSGGVSSPVVAGDGTIADPWKINIFELFPLIDSGIELNIKLATTTDEQDTTWVQVGIGLSFSTSDANFRYEGSSDAWIVRFALHGLPSGVDGFKMFPSLDALFILSDKNYHDPSPVKLLNVTAGGPAPLNGMHLEVGSVRAGLRFSESQNLVPVLELTDVLIQDISPPPTTTVGDWEILDLTSADTPAELLNSAMDMIQNQIASVFMDGGALQWIGSVLGLCSPRGGDFALTWNGGDGIDRRADPLRIVTDPIGCIVDYYANLVSVGWKITPLSGSPEYSWVYVFEAIGNLLKTGINGLLNPGYVYSPTIMEEESDADWRYPLIGDGSPPTIHLTTSFEDGSTPGIDPMITLGFNLIGARVDIVDDLKLELELGADLAQFTFHPVEDTVDTVLLLNAGLKFTLENHEVDPSNPTQRLPVRLTQLGSVSIAIDGVCGGLEWSRMDGMDWFVKINTPQIGWAYPDIIIDPNEPNSLSFSQLKNVRWDGLQLEMPDGSKQDPPPDPQSVTFFSNSPEEFTLDFVREDVSIGDIIFGTSGFNAPDLSALTLGQFRGLIGQFLVYKCGSFGFFLAAFLRIHPDIINLNLGVHVNQNGIVIPDWYESPTVNLPNDWRILHQSDASSFGLGPFSLPPDWPEIDLDALVQDPWNELNNFFSSLMGSISISGEPFAFPAMRLLWGLLHGKIPNLNKIDLGWGTADDSGTLILQVPDVKVHFEGDSSPQNPWSISLLGDGGRGVNFIMWVGPDGLPSGSLADGALVGLDDSVVNALENQMGNLHASLSQPPDWATTITDLLYNLGQFSPRVRDALAGWTRPSVISSLEAYSAFIQNSDGLVSVDSQHNSTGSWGSGNTVGPLRGSYLNQLSERNVMTEIFDFIDTTRSSTPGVQTKVLLIHPYWQHHACWHEILQEAGDVRGEVTGETDVTMFDFRTPSFIGSDISLIDFSHITTADYLLLNISMDNGSMDLEVFLAEQIKIAVDQIQQTHDPTPTQIILICSHMGGSAARNYLDIYQTPTDPQNIAGVCTIGTPHDGPDFSDPDADANLSRARHLLDSIGFGVS